MNSDSLNLMSRSTISQPIINSQWNLQATATIIGHFVLRWMKLEPIIQSEVSQKEKHQYSILTHIYGI